MHTEKIPWGNVSIEHGVKEVFGANGCVSIRDQKWSV